MDYGKRTTRTLMCVIAVFLVLAMVLSAGVWVVAFSLFVNNTLLRYGFIAVGLLLVVGLLSFSLTRIVYAPLKKLFEVIVYAGHSSRGGIAPDTETLRIGRELITSLALQIYDLASTSEQGADVVAKSNNVGSTVVIQSEKRASETALSLLDHVGTPVIGIDAHQNITVINIAACEYFLKKRDDVIGKPLYDAVSLLFHGEETLELWLEGAQANTAIGNNSWERVRVDDAEGNAIRQFDLVASFKKKDDASTETMITIYDRTEQYSRDYVEVRFVSLAVHELRTPLTVMHGYIEVFEDELGPTLDAEMASFMHKMKASAQQLTAFIGNILNVARVEENQLVLKLQQYRWPDIVNYAVSDLQLRAKVKGKFIEVRTEDELPPVAADRISIHEVLNNLVENAIKYSGDTEKIIITSTLNSEGLVEVSVQDFGIGIPADVMPGLFQKFYRSHKSNAQISGTGLGLYLSKAMVNAHGGNIWVRSKEGEGSTFTFTLQPYDQVKHQKEGDQDGIMRGAHGWIKNHSLNRQ